MAIKKPRLPFEEKGTVQQETVAAPSPLMAVKQPVMVDTGNGQIDLSNVKVQQPIMKPDVKNTNPAPGTVETYKNPETGRASGVTLPDGRTFLGLNQEDVNTIAQGEQQRTAIPQNAQPVGTAQQQAEVQAQQQFILQQFAKTAGMGNVQVGANGEILNGQPSQVDTKQAVLQLAADSNTLAAAGAGVGALLGGGVPGAIIGGAIGKIAGSIFSNIKNQKSENIAAQKSTLLEGQQDIANLIRLMQVDPANAQKYAEAYYTRMNDIAIAQSNLRADASSDLNLIVEQDATKELAKFSEFYKPGGARDILESKFQLALQAPNAQAALMELAIAQQSVSNG